MTIYETQGVGVRDLKERGTKAPENSSGQALNPPCLLVTLDGPPALT